MNYEYSSNILFIVFWTDIARFLQYFRNLSNSFINILAILQDFNRIFLKYILNIAVLCGSQYIETIEILEPFLLPITSLRFEFREKEKKFFVAECWESAVGRSFVVIRLACKPSNFIKIHVECCSVYFDARDAAVLCSCATISVQYALSRSIVTEYN